MAVGLLHDHVSWNVYRYIADYLHDAGVVILLLKSLCTHSVAGFSKRSQWVYLLLFLSRYLDLLDHAQHAYLVVHKLFFIAGVATTLILFRCFRDTYEAEKDTCSLTVIMLPTLMFAVVFANDSDVMEVLWTYSHYLEGFAMVPQYIFSYRDDAQSKPGVVAYIVVMGLYRTFYLLNWIHKKVHLSFYSDIHSWAGGGMNIGFFLDYVLFRTMGFSCLKRLALGVDDSISKAEDELRQRFGALLLATDAGPTGLPAGVDLPTRPAPDCADDVMPPTKIGKDGVE